MRMGGVPDSDCVWRGAWAGARAGALGSVYGGSSLWFGSFGGDRAVFWVGFENVFSPWGCYAELGAYWCVVALCGHAFVVVQHSSATCFAAFNISTAYAH